jgi:UDP-GlcNAc:undecaprenyl-phosphate GlcNAc-1-phosphate transferase
MIEVFIILFFFVLNYFFFCNFYKISLYLDVFDKPLKRKIHKKKVASIGGIFFLINFLFIIAVGYLFKIKLFYFNIGDSVKYFSFLITFILFFILGILDDKYILSYKIKFFFSFLFLLFLIKIDKNLVIYELRFSFLEYPILLKYFATFFTILCILLFINACNMIDGLNLLSISYFIFIIFFFIFNKYISNLFILLIFYYIFFIYLNNRNQIFLGDNGTISISFLLSYFFIKSYNANFISNVDIIFLIMAIPGLDMFRLFLERILNKKNPFKADSNHLHHLILYKFPKKNVASILLIFVLIFPYTLTFTKLSYLFILLITLLLYLTLVIFLKLKIKNKIK